MKTKRRLLSSLKSIFTLLALTLFLSSTFGQIKIIGIEIDNREVKSESETVTITIKGDNKKEIKKKVKLNDEFSSGTLFQIPDDITILLETSGNKQKLSGGTKHHIEIGAQGEHHKTLWGKVKHFVTSKLNWIVVTGGPTKDIQGAVQGTEFTVHVNEKKVQYHVTKGKVAIHRKIPVKITENENGTERHGGEVAIVEKSYLEAHHGKATLKYKHEDVKSYSTYQKAIQNISKELEKNKGKSKHPVDLIHDAGLHSLLGEFYLKNSLKEPRDYQETTKAVKEFTEALKIYQSIHSDDHLLVAESYLFLAGAYFASQGDVNNNKGQENLDKAFVLIKEDLAVNKEHYDYFVGLNDLDTAWGIGKDLVADYEDLAWAYELAGNSAEAKKYYNLADQLANKIKNH